MSYSTFSLDFPHAFSHGRTVDRFDSRDVASNYPAEYGNSFRECREHGCLLKVLEHVAPNISILDLPCGTGRLTRILVQANLLPEDKGHVLNHDAQALVPELIAFVNDSQEEAPVAQPVLSTPVHEDPIASVTH